MSTPQLDPYHSRTSPIHSLDARVKLALALALLFTIALVPAGALPVYPLLLALIWSLAEISELGIGFILRRSWIALPFALAALPVIFTLNGEPLFTLALGTWQITASSAGLERFFGILFKAWCSVQVAALLAATTPQTQLLLALRWLRIPRLLVSIVGLMWRYLYLLVEESGRLMRARTSRSAASPDPAHRMGGTVIWRARVTGGMAGSLMVRSLERSERVYAAMLARGYDGEIRTLPLPALSDASRRLMVLGLLGCGLILTLSILWG